MDSQLVTTPISMAVQPRLGNFLILQLVKNSGPAESLASFPMSNALETLLRRSYARRLPSQQVMISWFESLQVFVQYLIYPLQWAQFNTEYLQNSTTDQTHDLCGKSRLLGIACNGSHYIANIHFKIFY
jgi:hypothetical protein